ncbi:MAG TPA: agmatinase [Paracoccaceae bacterium]|nr:agmatinase [Paracoccaceae bacterium]
MGDNAITDRAFSGYSPHGLVDQDTYSGALSFLRRPYSKQVGNADVVVNGVPYDLAVTNRPGTRLGPRAIRAASSQIAWAGGPWRWPFDPTEVLEIVDWGDMNHDHGRPERFPATLEAHADALIATGAKMLSLGGDHFITYPLLKAHAKQHGPLALVQFDSHSDTWADDGDRIDHGTMFYRGAREGVIDAAHSVQIGIRSGNPETHGFTIIDADEAIESPLADLVAKIERVTAGRPVYLSFDIDFLDPAFAPGTGTPVCGGPTSHRAERILTSLTGLDIVGADVVEVSPPFDHAEITALAGATVAMNIIGIWAHRKRAAGG